MKTKNHRCITKKKKNYESFKRICGRGAGRGGALLRSVVAKNLVKLARIVQRTSASNMRAQGIRGEEFGD